MSPPPAVIFDLDGTLVDSLDDIALALGRALADAGLPPPPRPRVRAWVGDGARSLVARALAGRADVDAVLARFRDHYRAHPVVHTRVYDGVAAVLDAVVAAGRRLAILSNKPDDLTRTVADALLAAWPFAVVRGHRPDHPLKPDPAAALAVAAELGVAPARCTFVGDSEVDVATGRAAGMRTAAVSWGLRDRAVLAAAGPDHLVDAPAELLAALLGADHDAAPRRAAPR